MPKAEPEKSEGAAEDQPKSPPVPEQEAAAAPGPATRGEAPKAGEASSKGTDAAHLAPQEGGQAKKTEAPATGPEAKSNAAQAASDSKPSSAEPAPWSTEMPAASEAPSSAAKAPEARVSSSEQSVALKGHSQRTCLTLSLCLCILY